MRHPFRFRHLAAVAAVAAALATGAARARADVVPSELSTPPCTAPGQPCLTAGPEEDQEGTCVTATCTKQVRTRDGSTTPVAVPCYRCTAGGAKASASQPKSKSKSSGCAVAAEGGDAGGLAVAGALIAGLVLVTARRRGRRPQVTGQPRRNGSTLGRARVE